MESVMLKKLLLMCAMVFSLQIIVPNAQLIAQETPIQNDGVAVSLAKDLIWGLGKVGQGCVGLYRLWSAHMTKNRLYAMVGIPWTAMAAHATYKYYNIIKPIKEKYNTDVISLDGATELPRFSNWKSDVYKTSADVNAHKAKVNTDLDTDVKSSEDSEYGRYDLPKVLDAIQKEQSEINQDIKMLEDEFLVYFTFLPGIIFKSEYGLRQSYKDLRQERRIPGNEVRWNKEQFEAADRIMEATCKNSWWHYLCKINYGTAAKCWWDLKKRHMKLRALEEIVKAVIVGNSRPAPIQQAVSQTEQDHAVNIHRD
jgi:hypothetical protein